MAPAGDVLRRRSCSSTPCKVVECIFKRAMHAGRLVRCQNLLSPVLQRRRRRAAAQGCDFQRPAEMLARMAKADPQSIMAADLIIERADVFELLGQRGGG